MGVFNYLKDKIMNLTVSSSDSAIIINGQVFRGTSLQITNGRIIVDGQPQDMQNGGTQPIIVNITGDVQSIQLEVGDINCVTVSGNVTVGTGDVVCGNVGGHLQTGVGDVSCGSVGGNVSTNVGDIRYTK